MRLKQFFLCFHEGNCSDLKLHVIIFVQVQSSHLHFTTWKSSLVSARGSALFPFPSTVTAACLLVRTLLAQADGALVQTLAPEPSQRGARELGPTPHMYITLLYTLLHPPWSWEGTSTSLKDKMLRCWRWRAKAQGYMMFWKWIFEEILRFACLQ